MTKEEIIEQLISEAMVECTFCQKLFKPEEPVFQVCKPCGINFLEDMWGKR